MPELSSYINQLYSVGIDPIFEEFIPVTTTTPSPPTIARVEQRSDPDGNVYYVHLGNTDPVQQVESSENGFSDFVENLRRARERSARRNKEDSKIPAYKEDPNYKTIPW